MKEVRLYTDGACSGNPGPGGWGVVLVFGAHRKEMSGFEPQTTNNRMEMRAVIEGFKALKEPCVVTVYSDSRLVTEAFNQGWVTKWLQTDFNKGKVKNQDLWKQLLSVITPHRVRWVWIKGHSDDELNNRCDHLAKQAIAENT